MQNLNQQNHKLLKYIPYQIEKDVRIVKEVTAQIEKVVVYPQGCTITRILTETLEVGESILRIGPLSRPIDMDSVFVVF